MKIAFTTTTHFEHPAEEVWAMLTAWTRLPEWMPGVIAASGPPTPSVSGELRLSTSRGERVSVITDCDVDRLITFRSTSGPVTADYRYDIAEQREGRTDVTLTGRCDVSGPLALAAPLIRRTLRRTDGGQLVELRTVMDADAS